MHFTDPYIEDIAEPMNEWTSIFQAEAKAIETAAMTLLNLNTINEKIHLYSNSKAVLKALKKKNIKNKYIHNCHQALNKLGRNNKIKITWIPGHAGHQGNEIADTLAKEGSTKEIGNNLYTIPHADPIQKIEKYSKRKIIKQYKETNEHTQTITERLLERAKGSTKKLKRIMGELNATEMGIMSRILSGHNNLNHHQNRIQLSYDKVCDYCGDKKVEETAEHILTKCPKFSIERKQKIGEYYITTEEIGSNQSTKKAIQQILSFFQK